MGAGVVTVAGILLIVLLISIVGAIFVYTDVKKRQMNRKVWTAVAFVGPFLVGVLIYILNRTPISKISCSKCGASINVNDEECPSCKSKLITQCSNCHCPVEKGWTTCQICGTKLPEHFVQPVRVYEKEKGKGVVLGVVIVLIVAIFVSGIILFNASGNNSNENTVSGLEGMYNIDEKELSNNDTLSKWIESCKKGDEKIYVIVSKASRTCIIYVKDNGKLMTSNMDYHYDETDEWSAAKIQIMSSEYNDVFGYDFFLYKFDVYGETEIEVELDGVITDADVTYTDADISVNTWGGATVND